jgi:hypothetical protein
MYDRWKPGGAIWKDLLPPIVLSPPCRDSFMDPNGQKAGHWDRQTVMLILQSTRFATVNGLSRLYSGAVLECQN